MKKKIYLVTLTNTGIEFHLFFRAKSKTQVNRYFDTVMADYQVNSIIEVEDIITDISWLDGGVEK